MEKQWIQSLRSRFADRKVTPPNGLWNDVQKSLSEKNVISYGDKRARRAVSVLFRRFIVMAACFVGLFYISYIVFFNKSGSYLYVSDKRLNGGKVLMGAVGELLSEKKYSKISFNKNEKFILRDIKNDSIPECLYSDDEFDSIVVSLAGSDDNDAANIKNKYDSNKEYNTSVVTRRVQYEDNKYIKKSDEQMLASSDDILDGNSNISFSFFGSGMAALGSSSGTGTAVIMASNLYQGSIGYDNQSGNEVMLLSTAYTKKDVEPSTIKVRHRQPIRLGMSIRVEFWKRLGLNTGLNYSCQSSTISSDEEYKSYNTDQKLHFVGLPLALNYNIFNFDNIELYASAGGAVEFCVSGKAHTDYFLPNGETLSIDNNVRDRRPQWSVNASVGVQYKVNSMVGIYLEPGLSYYFDNGSDISSIYKEKPLNFNLAFGLRLMLR